MVCTYTFPQSTHARLKAYKLPAEGNFDNKCLLRLKAYKLPAEGNLDNKCLLRLKAYKLLAQGKVRDSAPQLWVTSVIKVRDSTQ